VPYEFGVKVAPMPALPAASSCAGQGAAGQCVIEATERLTRCTIERGYVDKGFRGHDTPNHGESSSRDKNAASLA
jgi:hypothetical protein